MKQNLSFSKGKDRLSSFQVVAKMLESGRSLSAALKGKAPPLMYAWHDSYYLGAAHGLTGILYLLMHVGCWLPVTWERAVFEARELKGLGCRQCGHQSWNLKLCEGFSVERKAKVSRSMI